MREHGDGALAVGVVEAGVVREAAQQRVEAGVDRLGLARGDHAEDLAGQPAARVRGAGVEALREDHVDRRVLGRFVERDVRRIVLIDGDQAERAMLVGIAAVRADHRGVARSASGAPTARSA